jgi:ABC-type multidrug transport system fused ATPase/permease subunit
MRLVRNVRDLKLVRLNEVASLFVLTLLSAGFEGVSIAMLLPILEFVDTGGNVGRLAAASRLWRGIVDYHAFIHVKVTLISLMLSVVILVLFRQVFDYSKRVYSTVVGEKTLLRVRERAFKAYLDADLGFFYDHNVGSMINTLMLDGTNASYTFMGLVQCLGFAILALVYMGFLLTINASATLLAVAVVALSALCFAGLMRQSRQYGRVTTKFNKKLTEMLVERFGAARLIKLASSQARETAAHAAIVEKLYEQKVGVTKVKGLIDSMMQMLVLLAGLTILYSATQVFHMSLVQVSIFLFVLLRLLPLSQEFFSLAQTTVTNNSSLVTVSELIENATKANTIRGGSREFTGLSGELSLKGVGFRYAPDGPFVLQDVSLDIPAFSMTAIVGRSGAGKSTLADLLPRLIKPLSGAIFADGVDIQEFSLESLRSRIAFVSQEGFIFDTSVLENIRYARPDATLDEVKWAAKHAYVSQFIEVLPRQYDTLIGERGVKLSGGQKQRILLARALLQKASVIVLDEPTSALDSESEQYIQKAIESIRREKSTTMFIIAHRLSTIRSADRIYVLDGGRVVESGAHDELIHGDEWYSDMFRIQSGREHHERESEEQHT